MSPGLLPALVVIPAATVVVALFAVLWSERTTARSRWVAVLTGLVLAAWAIGTGVLASSGSYRPPDTRSFPPLGLQLVVALVLMAACLAASRTLRSLLTNQKNLIRMNVWRLEGMVFLLLMLTGQVPALWALPAGMGDVAVGASAFWVASRLDEPGGKRRAIIFNLLGLTDLIVAVGLGITTNPGATQLFHTTPTAELLTQFPLALVPGFLVPLAFMLHIVTLWQLLGGTWERQGAA